MSNRSTVPAIVKKVTAGAAEEVADTLAAEEPLEIQLSYLGKGKRITKSISVTMRTPGADVELATGFLYTEGIISGGADVKSITCTGREEAHVVLVELADGVVPDMARLERNFYTTSSCGVCGKTSIEAVRSACTIIDTKDTIQVSAGLLYGLPALLRARQDVFEHTGGLHACALFSTAGGLLLLHEDVGRHNALDKLIGAAISGDMLPLDDHILLLSGRASFELMQKAAMAGIKIVAAVGAPSGLAVQMAEDWGMTLIGFLRGERFNIYSGAQRIVI